MFSKTKKFALLILIPTIFIVLFVASFFIAIFEASADEFDSIYGNTIQEKVWWALKDCGFSDEQVAGAMGNIHYESVSFNPEQVEIGYDENSGGIGLCQWTNNNRGTER